MQSAWTMVAVSNLRAEKISNLMTLQIPYSVLMVLPTALCIRWMGLHSLNEMEPDYPWLSAESEISDDSGHWISTLWRQSLVVIPTILIPAISIAMHFRFGMPFNAQTMAQHALTIVAEIALLGYWMVIGDGTALRNKDGSNFLWLFPTAIWLIAAVQLVLWRMSLSFCREAGHIAVSLIQFMVLLNPSLCLVLGANSHMILVYILGATFCATLTRSDGSFNSPRRLSVVSNVEVWIGWLLHQYLFFVTGHRCVFSQISFKAPYVGLFQYHWWRALVLIVLHQFSGHLLAFLVIPILVALRLSFEGVAVERKWMVNAVRHSVSKYATISAFCSTLLLLCSMCNCFMHRRHLLVWDVFAPKVIFDITNVVAVDVLSALSVALVSAILSRVEKRKVQ